MKHSTHKILKYHIYICTSTPHALTEEYSHGHLNSYRFHTLILVFLCLKFSFLGVSQVQKSVSSLGYPLVSLSQNREQWESPFPPPLDNNNKPPVRVIEETITKIYYFAVPRKRSTAVLDTEERLDPPRKKR